MNREQYVKLTREKLDEYGLKKWSIRINTNADSRYLGLCDYRSQSIILNAHHLDIHPEPEVRDTILHEIAHALCPGMGHNSIWADKARKLGCTNTLPTCSLSLPPNVIDAIRSGASVETKFEEHVIRTVKYEITQAQDRCPECGKIAKEKSRWSSKNKNGDDVTFIILECLHIISKVVPKGTPFETVVSNDWKEEVKNCKHVWDKNKCKNCSEFRPFPYQVQGAKFLESAVNLQRGGLVADEMGLGKTIQSLMLLKFHPELFPVLFVVKSGLKYQWSKEIWKWLGPAYAPQIIEVGNHYILPGFKSYIISYDLLRRIDHKKLDSIGIKTIILDESQLIKNVDSSRTHNVRRLAKDPMIKVIGLSGTPWKNRGSEFFSILNLIDPIKFYSYEAFKEVWVEYYFEGARRKEGGIRNPKAFREHVKDLMIRRERVDVMPELPLVNRTKLYVRMNDTEQKIYDKEEKNFAEWYQTFVLEGREDSINGIELIGKMARMRHLIGLAKIPITVEHVKDFVEDNPNRKIVVFCHHIDVAEILFDELKELGIPIGRLKGGMAPEDRFKIQEKFNNTTQMILIASQLAAGEGLNLQTGADCIMHERQWNPANEEQCEGRFVRIGQKATQVNAIYTEGEESIDVHFDGIIEKKRRSFFKVMSNRDVPTWNGDSIIREMAASIYNSFKSKNKSKSKIMSDMNK